MSNIHSVSYRKRPVTTAALPELKILKDLREHRLLQHGSEAHNLVFCEECARLEGQLELLTRFLDAPTGEEIM